MKIKYKKRNGTKASAALALALAVALMAVITAGCGSGGKSVTEAEEAVRAGLETLKSDSSDLSGLTDIPDGVSEAMLDSYEAKLRDFEYDIAGSESTGSGEDVTVTVNITTYDFGSVYLETWNDWMKDEESMRFENQFYSDLFTRFSAMADKSYTGQAEIICTRDESGEWNTDIRTNEALMNAISGGLLAEIKALTEE